MVETHHDLGERIQALTLLTAGWHVDKIVEYTTLSRPQIYKIAQKARERGFQPDVNHIILAEYCEDAPRYGRPTVATPEQQTIIEQTVTKDRYAREKTVVQLGHDVGLSATSVWRILRRLGYRKCKPSTKPGLTQEIKDAGLV